MGLMPLSPAGLSCGAVMVSKAPDRFYAVLCGDSVVYACTSETVASDWQLRFVMATLGQRLLDPSSPRVTHCEMTRQELYDAIKAGTRRRKA